jgi:CheY-like chemotaxis protein
MEEGRSRRLPAIALTAYASEEDTRRALTAGFDAHLSKPVDPGRLVEVAAGLAGRRGD